MDSRPDIGAAAFAGSLANGPVADAIGRKRSIIVAVVIFTVGSAIQAGGVTIEMLFAGKCSPPRWSLRKPVYECSHLQGRIIAGIAVGMLTMIVPMYISEVSAPEIRGTLVVMQQCKSIDRLTASLNLPDTLQ